MYCDNLDDLFGTWNPFKILDLVQMTCSDDQKNLNLIKFLVIHI